MFDLLLYPGIDLKCMSFLTDFTPFTERATSPVLSFCDVALQPRFNMNDAIIKNVGICLTCIKDNASR